MHGDDNGSVRIYVTCEGLWRLDPSLVRDVDSAFKLLNEHRSQIEQVASTQFTKDGPDDGNYEGQPIITLRGDDIAP